MAVLTQMPSRFESRIGSTSPTMSVTTSVGSAQTCIMNLDAAVDLIATRVSSTHPSAWAGGATNTRIPVTIERSQTLITTGIRSARSASSRCRLTVRRPSIDCLLHSHAERPHSTGTVDPLAMRTPAFTRIGLAVASSTLPLTNVHSPPSKWPPALKSCRFHPRTRRIHDTLAPRAHGVPRCRRDLSAKFCASIQDSTTSTGSPGPMSRRRRTHRRRPTRLQR